VPEVKHFCPQVPIILVCCKSDLRDDAKVKAELQKSGQSTISNEQGEKTRSDIKAAAYIECSAFKGVSPFASTPCCRE